MFTILSIFVTSVAVYFLVKLLRLLLHTTALPAAKLEESYLKFDWLVAIVFYLGCFIVFFYAVLPTFSTHLIGPLEDNVHFYWNLWWANRSFEQNPTLFEKFAGLTYTRHIFFPEGTSLFLVPYSFFNVAASFALKPALNLVSTYNLLVGITFVWAGAGAFFLTRYLTRNSYVAFIAGFLFAFNPSHIAHAQHHINITSIQFIPFFVLYFIKVVRGNARKDFTLACIYFLLNTLCSWYYFIYCIYFMVFSYIYLAIKKKKVLLIGIATKIVWISSISVILLSPWIVNMIGTVIQERGQIHVGLKSFQQAYVVDLIAFVLPHTYHPFNHLSVVDHINKLFTGHPWESTAYLGMANIIIVVSIFKSCFQKISKYLLGMIPFMLLAMGSYLHIFGKVVSVWLPYNLIQHIPIFSMARTPSRAIVFVYLFWSIIVALCLCEVFKRIKKTRLGSLLGMLLLLIMFFDYFALNDASTKIALPNCYAYVADKGINEYAVLDYPVHNYQDVEKYMMYQTLHEIPMVLGRAARSVSYSKIRGLQLDALWKQKRLLTDNKVKYIVVHKGTLNDEDRIGLKKFTLQFSEIYEDQRNIVYRVY